VADFSMVVGARDEATAVLKDVRASVDMLARSVTQLGTDTEKTQESFEFSFKTVAIGTGVVAGALAALATADYLHDLAEDGLKSFHKQSDAAKDLAEDLLLVDGRMKGLRDSEIDLTATSSKMSQALKLLDDAGVLAGSVESVQAYEDALEGSTKATDRAYASIGALLAPFETLRMEGIEATANAFSNVLTPAIELVEDSMLSFSEAYGTVGDAFVNTTAGALALFDVFSTRTSATFELITTSAAFSFESIKNDVTHLFVDVIPKYANWFVENFPELFDDACTGAFIAVKNFATNATDALQVLFDYFASGGEGGLVNVMVDLQEIASRDLLEGFKATAAELPEIIARDITDREAELAMKMALLGGSLAGSFADAFEDRKLQIESLFDGPDKAKVDKPDEINAADKNARANESLAPTESRLLTRGPSDGPLQNLVEEAKEQKELQKQTLKAIEENNRLQSMRDKQVQMELIV